ncbi:MAG: efflux RND transporter periplasmic adaptor subunit [Deltaproteobacteria bacterium]|nr:efflux RND transporter periplasmic adaptor subunit [Deltaproteobacteria bacterium]
MACAILVSGVGCAGEPGSSKNDKEAGHRQGHQEESGHDEGEESTNESAHVSAEKLEHAGVTFAAVGPGHVDDGVQLLGTIRPNGDRLAHITPRFPGIVREGRRNVGDTVKAGEVLAIIESSESLSPYELQTLIDGTIIEKHLTRGEAVDRDKQAFVIADLSSVWVELSVYQRDLEHVRVGETVRIRSGEKGPQAEGIIVYITPGVDERMRTATARVVLPNPDGQWRIGSFVEAYAVSPHAAALVVPANAIQSLEGTSVVFVAERERVEARPVILGHRGETLVEILSGLADGERIATVNSFLLKAELGKGAAEHDH